MPGGIFHVWEGKPKPQGSASLVALVSAFVPTWASAVVFVAIFVAIRHRFPKIYSPRTFIGTIPEKDRTPSERRAYFDWVHTLRAVPDKFTLYHHGLDTYLFLRFLRTLMFICVVGSCLTWPILLPINASGGGTSSQLDKITIANVANKKKLYSHAVLAWAFFSFVLFTIARERLWLIGLRQAWNSSKQNSKRLSSRTVLFLSAPKEALKEQNLQRYFGEDAVRLWPATSVGKLEGLVSERSSNIEKLETAEVSLIQAINKKARKGRRHSAGQVDNDMSYDSLPDNLKKSFRPQHRPTTSPGSQQVDSIDWYREQIQEKDAAIDQARQAYDPTSTADSSAAVFVEFRTLVAAQRAYQQVTSSELFEFTPRYTEITPGDVIWKNLTLPSARRISQEGIATALVVATILFWFIPIAFVGTISNVAYLANTFKWLSFLNKLPDVVMGLLTGLVPPLLTSLLSKYVPNIFRYIFTTFGEPTKTSAELKVLKWFYVFQVVHVFLVTAVASGSAAAIPQIVRRAAEDPASVPVILARNIPTSSNFYLNYFIVQGFTSGSDNLLNYSDLLSYLFYDYFFDKTPRQKYNSFTSLKGISWGKVFPKYTNFVIIAIVYSCIAPLVLGFAFAGLALFYLSYRYMLLYTTQPKLDTKGKCYTLALQQIITGVYIAELSLIGLFSLRSATGPTIMLAILLLATIIYNILLNKYFTPLETFLPADIESEVDDPNADAGEETPLLSASTAEQGHAHSAHEHIQSIQRLPRATKNYTLHPRLTTSHKAVRRWLTSSADFSALEIPTYTEQQLRTAYVNPALRSDRPLIWLPRDPVGVSRNEVRECEECGLEASDEGAWVDGKGRVRWEERDFAKVPISRGHTVW